MKQTTSHRPKWRVLTSYVLPWPTSESIDGNHLKHRRFSPYIAATLMILVLTLVFWKNESVFTVVNIALLYLLPVLITAVRWGLWPSFYTAGIGVVAFDFFFVPPLYTYTVSDARYLISFAVYVAVATFTASLASQLRQRLKEAREREAVTSVLFSLSTQVAAARDLDSVLAAIAEQSFGTFGLSATIVLPNDKGQLNVGAPQGFQDIDCVDDLDPRVMQWVYEHGKMAGYGTNIHNNTSLVYVPLKTESKIHGVMCFADKNQMDIGVANNRIRVVQALAGLAAVSIARVHAEEDAKIAHLTAESERLRTALLDSISHELRTPLATILGAVTAMIENRELFSERDQNELLATVREGAMRMNRLVTNLLGMVRLESGMLRLNKGWCDISDIVGVSLRQVQDSLQKRAVDVNIQDHLPAILVDDILIEQVLVNLLSNAIKYSRDESPIRIDIMEYDGIVTLRVRDWGVGTYPDEVEKIFDKFYRSDAQKSIPGTGLGLAICKGIVQAHHGEIFARNADDRGLVVTVRLPIDNASEFSDETPVQSEGTSLWEQKS